MNTKLFWTKEKIIEQLKLVNKDKLDLNDLINLQKEGVLCHRTHIRVRVGSIKEACKLAGKTFIGTTYEDIFGLDSAKKRIEKGKKSLTKWNKENILEGLKLIYKKYGEVKPTDINIYLRQERLCCGSVIQKHFGSISNAFQAAGIPYKDYYWTNERIIARLKQLYEENGPFAKTHINKVFLKEDKICGAKLIRDRFGSLEEAAKQADINFITPKLPSRPGHGKIGRLEKGILDKIETEKGIKLIRQFQVARKFIDGYDPINNVAYEVDERNHKYNQVQDYLREQVITEEISCTFERIKLF